MHKAVRSKALILEKIKDVPRICNYDWEELIPDNLDDNFYDSLMNQFDFFINIQKLNIAEACKILETSTKTYYKFKNLQDEPNNENSNENENNTSNENLSEDNENSNKLRHAGVVKYLLKMVHNRDPDLQMAAAVAIRNIRTNCVHSE